MFKDLKKKIAKVALMALTLQLAFVGFGTGAGQAFAATSTVASPTLISLTAKIGGETQTVLAGQNLKAYKGQTVVPNMYAKLSESDLTFVSGTTGDITITGPLGGSATDVTADYGTFTLVGDEAIITPNPGNATLADLGTFTFTVAADTIQNDAGITNEETTFGLEVTNSPAPELVNVTAEFGGVIQTRDAGNSLTAIVGQKVGDIYASVSEDSILVSPLTFGTITISGGTIPAGTPYGTFVVDPTDATKLLITPNAGNDELGQEGTFVFSVASGQIQSVSGTTNTETDFSLVVVSNKITAIGAISGVPQVGQELTAGALTPIDATASYQWQISTSAVGVYQDIIGATSSKYTPVAADLGKFVRVIASGTGDYVGNAISDATAAVKQVAAPAGVTGLVTLVNSDGTVTLNWEKPIGDFSGFRVLRDGVEIFEITNPSQTTYTDNNTVRGQSYTYSIVVFNEAGVENVSPVTAQVAIPQIVVAAAVSDTTDYSAPSNDTNSTAETNTNASDTTSEVKAQADESNSAAEKSSFPTWGVILLILIAAVGGYLIWNQKPTVQPIVTVETKKRETGNKIIENKVTTSNPKTSNNKKKTNTKKK